MGDHTEDLVGQAWKWYTSLLLKFYEANPVSGNSRRKVLWEMQSLSNLGHSFLTIESPSFPTMQLWWTAGSLCHKTIQLVYFYSLYTTHTCLSYIISR